MKTWQMIKELTENPGKKFISDKGQKGNEMTAERFQQNIVFKYTNRHVDVDSIAITREWEEVKKSVTWQEAFEAWVNGKGFTIEYQGNIYKQPKMNKLGCFGINVSNGFEERMFTEGTWYIED